MNIERRDFAVIFQIFPRSYTVILRIFTAIFCQP